MSTAHQPHAGEAFQKEAAIPYTERLRILLLCAFLGCTQEESQANYENQNAFVIQ